MVRRYTRALVSRDRPHGEALCKLCGRAQRTLGVQNLGFGSGALIPVAENAENRRAARGENQERPSELSLGQIGTLPTTRFA